MEIEYSTPGLTAYRERPRVRRAVRIMPRFVAGDKIVLFNRAEDILGRGFKHPAGLLPI